MLQQAIEACAFLPIESKTLITMVAMLELINECKSCKTGYELEVLAESVRKQRSLLLQLISSVKQAMTDLAKIVNKRKADLVKKDKEKDVKQQEQTRAANVAAQESEKKRLGKTKRMEPFKISFGTHGVTDCVTFSDDAAFQKAVKDKVVDYSKPFMLSASSLLTQVAEDSANTLKATLDRWSMMYENSAVAKKNDAVRAPLSDAFGHGEVSLLREMVLPATSMRKSANPELAKDIDRFELYGQTQFFLQSDFEDSCMGSLRIQYTGHTKCIMFPASTALAFLKSLKQPASFTAVRSVGLVLTNDLVKHAKEQGCEIVHGCIVPLSILVAPAGWIVLQTTLPEGDIQKVTGLRTSFIHKDVTVCKLAADQLQQLKSLTGAPQTVEALLDLVTAEMAAGR